MGTQKHRLEGGDEPPRDSTDDEQDLGIPTEGPPMAEDPTGFTPKAGPQMLAGRQVRPLDPGDLSESHRRYAGADTPMFGASSFGKGPQAEQGGMPPPQAQQGARRPREEADAQAQAQRLMPQYLNEGPPQQPARQQYAQPQQGTPPPSATYPDPNDDTQQLKDYRMMQTTAALEYLTKEEQAARERGDYLAAEQARNMTERLGDDFHIQRVPQGEGRHPAMEKLLANLGLEKIERQEVPWGGSKWLFAATPPTLDHWVSTNMEEDGRNFAALLVSAGLVGLDGIPIYQVLGVPLTAKLVVTEKATGETRKVDVALYRKICDCGYEMEVTAKECANCKMLHDPFDIPTDLRQKCAVAWNEMLENKFGAYEELAYLVEEKNLVMKNRTTDKEELYPLVMPSPEQKTTTTSPSGDES